MARAWKLPCQDSRDRQTYRCEGGDYFDPSQPFPGIGHEAKATNCRGRHNGGNEPSAPINLAKGKVGPRRSNELEALQAPQPEEPGSNTHHQNEAETKNRAFVTQPSTTPQAPNDHEE